MLAAAVSSEISHCAYDRVRLHILAGHIRIFGAKRTLLTKRWRWTWDNDVLGEHVFSTGMRGAFAFQVLVQESKFPCRNPGCDMPYASWPLDALCAPQMIKITLACGGDIIKFAGDALIALWSDGSPRDLAHRACECALELQDVLHDSPMTQTIRLSLKVCIRASTSASPDPLLPVTLVRHAAPTKHRTGRRRHGLRFDVLCGRVRRTM